MSGPVLEVRGLRKSFAKDGADVVAVDGVSFSVAQGECLGIVGESGSGKSTVVNLAMRLADVDEGAVLLNGRDITNARGRTLREAYGHMQMVFQQPAASFDPRCTLGEGIAESLRARGASRREARARAEELLGLVELPAEMYDRYPLQVSGGQCQRAAIARAVAVGPDLLVCDEATSALDRAVQGQIIELLEHLREELGMALMFICHDIALVEGMCDRVIVMKAGRIVEEGSASEVLRAPRHAYTKTLLEASRWITSG